MSDSSRAQDIKFKAPEYQADGSFKEINYDFSGTTESGWKIFREGELSMELGPGYAPIKALYCGVCSTDLARRFLPYPLPQIIGHEVVGMYKDKPVVVEINASPLARQIKTSDPFSLNHLETHSPERITLGIDRLPGGFSPYFLAPVGAIVPVPDEITPLSASLTEPFAAALQGVDATTIQAGDKVAVLGPRRLGMLILSALAGFRKEKKIDFEIIALIRHDRLKELCLKLGADRTMDTRNTIPDGSFDVVFDTTGKPEGFADALRLAKRSVSLKSTNGQPVLGLNTMTDLVVDEMAILPWKTENLNYKWPFEQARSNVNIFVSPTVPESVLESAKNADEKSNVKRNYYRMSIKAANEKVRGSLSLAQRGTATGATPEDSFPPGGLVPRFDLAIATTLAEMDEIIRPVSGLEFSILRPRGAILLAKGKSDNESQLTAAVLQKGMEVRTSRCGDFHRTMDLLKHQPELARAFEKEMITHKYALKDIAEAFAVASDSEKSVKVIVESP